MYALGKNCVCTKFRKATSRIDSNFNPFWPFWNRVDAIRGLIQKRVRMGKRDYRVMHASLML